MGHALLILDIFCCLNEILIDQKKGSISNLASEVIDSYIEGHREVYIRGFEVGGHSNFMGMRMNLVPLMDCYVVWFNVRD